MTATLGIDIGGSGIKAAVVDHEAGELCSERRRLATPRPATPAAVAEAVDDLVSVFDYSGPVGCCFPTIVVDGRAKSASNMGREWIDVAIDETLSAATDLPFGDAVKAEEHLFRVGRRQRRSSHPGASVGISRKVRFL